MWLSHTCCAAFAGQPTLARLTRCWHGLYEFYDWSNVVCVPRKHFMYPVMEQMSFRPLLRNANSSG